MAHNDGKIGLYDELSSETVVPSKEKIKAIVVMIGISDNLSLL